MGERQDVTLFTEVDKTGDPEFFIRFLDQANAIPSIRSSKLTILDGLRLREGLSVLDIGCGAGDDVIDIARHVGPSGFVIGIDISQAMIAVAQQRTASSGLPILFQVGDAMNLEFESNRFDACRTERMLMHVPEADQAFSEMVRVIKPGGRVAVFDFDWDTFLIDSPDRTTTRQIVTSFSDSIRNGWIGRQLRRMFLDAGLTDVVVVPHQIFIGIEFLGFLIGGHLTRAQQLGTLDTAEVKHWWDNLHDAAAADRFHASFTAFIVSGTKA